MAVTPAEITPLVSAPVAHVLVHNAQPVDAGQILVVLDDSDARIAVQRAAAHLAEVERQAREDFADDRQLAALIAVQAAQVVAAQANLGSMEPLYREP